MKTWNEVAHLSNRPDVAILKAAERFQLALEIGVFGVTGIVLAGWLIPGFGALLFDGWSLMKANTALGLLLCTVGVLFSRRRQTRTVRASTVLAGVAAATLAASALIGYVLGQPNLFDTWLAPDASASLPGRMSISTALYLLSASLAVAARVCNGSRWQLVADVFATLMLVQALIILGAYLHSAWRLVVTSEDIVTSPQTLFSIMLLTPAAMIGRLRSGLYALIVGVGIGSSFLRIGMVWMFVVPFGITMLSLTFVEWRHFELQLASTLTAAFASVITLLYSLMIARKLNRLEADLRVQSLTDPLTGLHNRRGFELLGEQRLQEAMRNRSNVALLYFDLDGLKQVNDRYGHEVGSQLIQDFANLLAENLRQSDILGRLGGDEFAVILHDSDDSKAYLSRLEQAAAIANARIGQPYAIAYSVGVEQASPDTIDTLSDLLNRADEAMYENKRGKRHAVSSSPDTAPVG